MGWVTHGLKKKQKTASLFLIGPNSTQNVPRPFVDDWTEEDFLHVAPSDEFYIYVVRKPNHQNDRI